MLWGHPGSVSPHDLIGSPKLHIVGLFLILLLVPYLGRPWPVSPKAKFTQQDYLVGTEQRSLRLSLQWLWMPPMHTQESSQLAAI